MSTNTTDLEAIENISFKLEGKDAERFRAYKKRQNIRSNSEAARKALFDQIDTFEAEQQAMESAA